MYKCTPLLYNIINYTRDLYLMAIHTFSTKTKKPEDERAVLAVKYYCAQRHLNFSAIVIELLKQYEAEHAKV